jgi:ribosomal protein L39E
VYDCQVDTVHNFGDREWKDPEIIPESLISNLTTCSLRSYKRTNCEFQFAKYIMQNSRVLSTVTIRSARRVDTNTKLQMLKELSLCPRNSATCKLLFIWLLMDIGYWITMQWILIIHLPPLLNCSYLFVPK